MHRGPVAWQFPTKLHTDAMIGLDVDSQLDNNTLVQIGREIEKREWRLLLGLDIRVTLCAQVVRERLHIWTFIRACRGAIMRLFGTLKMSQLENVYMKISVNRWDNYLWIYM